MSYEKPGNIPPKLDQIEFRPLPWCLAMNGVVIGRFMYQADCLDALRRRAALVNDISRFRYWYDQGSASHAA